MRAETYESKIKKFGIEHFGFDTHSRALGISKAEVKAHWNEVTGGKFKRLTRTEYTFSPLPEFSSYGKPLFRLNCQDYLSFCLTPTAPLIVPDGFITDKGSVPMLLQSVVSIEDREMIIPFLFHDVESVMERMSRFMADGLILEIGSDLGASWLKRASIHAAVRIGNRYNREPLVIKGENITQRNKDLIRAADALYLERNVTKSQISFT